MVWTLWPLESSPVAGSSGAVAPDEKLVVIPTARHWLADEHVTPKNWPTVEKSWTAAVAGEIRTNEKTRTLDTAATNQRDPIRELRSLCRPEELTLTFNIVTLP
jgi:hypothetical protein